MATIQGIYIALFGRPADPLGLDYFNSVTDNGADLSAIGDLAGTAEYQDRFVGQNNVQIVTAIYQSLFGRNPDAAGLAFFVAELQSGRQTVNTIAINILDGAQGEDAALVEAKEAAANQFTAAVRADADALARYQGDAGIEFGQDFIGQVDSADDEFADAEVAAQVTAFGDGGGVVGDTFTLTDEIDDLEGTSNGDTFQALAADIQTFDAVDGAGGVDTFEIVGDISELPASSNFRNIEIFNLNQANNGVAVDASSFAAAGATQVWQIDNAGVTDNLEAGVTAGFRDTLVEAADVITAEEDAASISVALDNVDGGSVITVAEENAGDVTSLSITGSVDGDFDIDTAGLTAIDTVTLAITSDTEVSFGIGTGLTLEVLDASASEGDLEVTLYDNFVALTEVTLGAGNDELYFDQESEEDVSIDLGAGNDYIGIYAYGDVEGASVELTLGAGGDTVYLDDLTNVLTATADDFFEEALTIADFDLDEDVLDLSGLGALSTQNLVTQAFDEDDSLFEAVELVAAAQDNNVAQFVYDGDLYIYNDQNGSGTFDADDGLVKLTGVDELLSVGSNLIVA